MKKKCLNPLTTVNIELTSRCNAKCWMCGRRRLEKQYPELANWGDMSFEMIEKIAKQLPSGIICQLHSDGEPTLFPRLEEAIKLFHRQIVCFNTNGILLTEPKISKTIIGNLDTLTISVYENNPLANQQYENVKEFIKLRGNNKPNLIYRCLGKVELERWEKLPGIVATRTLHSPHGSHTYEKKVTVPEIGICLDLLSHLVIDRFGNVFPCVRFNPHKFGKLGNINDKTLDEMWNSKERQEWIQHHIRGERNKVDICRETKCQFWGCPIP